MFRIPVISSPTTNPPASPSLIPLVWVVAQNDLVYQALSLAHILSGMFFAAITLAHVNVLIKLSPETGRSFYIAAFNTFIGASVAAAPIAGGALLQALDGVQLTVGAWNLVPLQILFLFSGFLQLLVLLLVVSARGLAESMLTYPFLKSTFKTGDRIRFGEVEGRISKIDAASIHIETGEGTLVVSNRELASHAVLRLPK